MANNETSVFETNTIFRPTTSGGLLDNNLQYLLNNASVLIQAIEAQTATPAQQAQLAKAQAAGAVIALSPEQLISVNATESPAKAQGRTFSEVSVSFVRDPNDLYYDHCNIWFTGYKGNTQPVLMTSGKDSPISFLCETTGETVTVTAQPVGSTGIVADFDSALSTTVILNGVVHAPPPPTILQDLVATPQGYQFSFGEVVLNPGDEDVIAGYNVYRNTSNSFTGASVVFTFKHNPTNTASPIVVQDSVPAMQAFCYWVTSVNTIGLESVPAPAQPALVGSGVALDWTSGVYLPGSGSVVKTLAGTFSYTTNQLSSVNGAPSTANVDPAIWQGPFWAYLPSPDAQWRTIGGYGASTGYAFSLTNFGFSLPSSATIGGVQIGFGVVGQTAPSGAVVDGVTLVYGGALVGTAKTPNTSIPGGLIPSPIISYGGSGDTWGYGSLDYTHVNDSTFGFAISLRLGGIRCFLNTFSMAVFWGTGGTSYVTLAWGEVDSITNVAVASNVLTVTVPNSAIPGQLVSFSNVANATFLNGNAYIVTSATSSQITAYTTHVDYASASDTGKATVYLTLNRPTVPQPGGASYDYSTYLGIQTISGLNPGSQYMLYPYVNDLSGGGVQFVLDNDIPGFGAVGNPPCAFPYNAAGIQTATAFQGRNDHVALSAGPLVVTAGTTSGGAIGMGGTQGAQGGTIVAP